MSKVLMVLVVCAFAHLVSPSQEDELNTGSGNRVDHSPKQKAKRKNNVTADSQELQSAEELRTMALKNDSGVFSYELIKKAATNLGTSAYIGCFSVTKEWPENNVTKITIGRKNDVITCIEECWEKRLRFSLLKDSVECLCCNLIHGMAQTEASNCFTPCAGRREHICGGSYTFSVYYTGYTEEPLYTHIEPQDVPKKFEGCYEDPAYSALCPFTVTTSRLSVPMCMAFCEDNLFQYAALDTPAKCCCSNTKEGAYLVKKESCPLLCKADRPDELCGGDYGYLAVYATDVTKLITDFQPSVPKLFWMQPNIDETSIQRTITNT